MVEALGKIGERRAVPVLQEIVLGKAALGDQPSTVAGCGDEWNEEMVTMGVAVRALGMIRDDGTIPTLVAGVKEYGHAIGSGRGLGEVRTNGDSLTFADCWRGSRMRTFAIMFKETLTAVGWSPGRM